ASIILCTEGTVIVDGFTPTGDRKIMVSASAIISKTCIKPIGIGMGPGKISRSVFFDILLGECHVCLVHSAIGLHFTNHLSISGGISHFWNLCGRQKTFIKVISKGGRGVFCPTFGSYQNYSICSSGSVNSSGSIFK